MFETMIANVREKAPLVHNISNFVTVNDCANIILAAGGSPIMSGDLREVNEITSLCNSFVANMGATDKMEAILMAGKKCNELGHPAILDPVGAGASGLRNQMALQLTKEVCFSVVRGNISEIKTIYNGKGTTKGVDADAADAISEKTLNTAVSMAKALSLKTGSVIVISGVIDIVADSKTAYIIRNGHPMMAQITGSGCMSSALIGTYCGANPERILEATAAAVCVMGVCGELAFEKTERENAGILSFRTYLIDAVSTLDLRMLTKRGKVEIC